MRIQASFLLLIWSIADLLCTVEVRGTCSITKEKKETGYKSYHPFEGLKKSKKTGWAVEVAEDARIDELDGMGPGPRKVDTSGVSYAALVSVADVSASKSSGARRLHHECRLRVL